MSNVTIGLVDYGFGNHLSVISCLRELGFRVKVSSEPAVLDDVEVLLIPGVGAFPAAMRALHQLDLVVYLQQQAKNLRPIVGICLGMQLLASASHEFEYTKGLDIIPGEFIPLTGAKWHIGWNTLECISPDSWLELSDGQDFYFNHSFAYQGPLEYQAALSRNPEPLAALIRKGKVVGIQFHPEKSQVAGRTMLSKLLLELTASA
jgi:glutamine amidotransferase